MSQPKGTYSRGAGYKRASGAPTSREAWDHPIGPPRPRAAPGEQSWGPLPKRPPTKKEPYRGAKETTDGITPIRARRASQKATQGLR